MRKKQIIALILVFIFLSVASFTFVVAENKISSDLEVELSTRDFGSVDILLETYSQDYSSIIAAIESHGGVVTNEFKYAFGVAAEIPLTALIELKALPNVKKISKDTIRDFSSSTPIFNNKDLDAYLSRETELSMDGREIQALSPSQMSNILDTVPETYWNYFSMNALSVWAEGYMGQDSLAVIIDTGVWADHVMLGRYPDGRVIGGVDLTTDVGTGYEGYDNPLNHYHGTHCAGILAGGAVIFAEEGDLLLESFLYYSGLAPIPAEEFDGPEGWFAIPLFGMAPMAQIYGIKVFDHTGAGVPESDIIESIEYAIAMHESGVFDVDVISMSLGGGTGYDGRDLEDRTVDYATSIGITVVTSAGNDGPASITVGSPGSAKTSIAVGATADPVNTKIFWDNVYEAPGIGEYLYTRDTPEVIYFSSRGPTSDGRLKPDLCATGVYVLSGTTPDPLSGSTLAWASGTSMACPAVAGAVALLNSWGESKGASPSDYKEALKDGAVWLEGYKKHEQGAGLLNIYNSWTSLKHDLCHCFHHRWHQNRWDCHRGGHWSRAPVKPMGINTRIKGKGSFTYDLVDMEQGHPIEFYLEVTKRTKSITITLSDIELGVDPILFNSFELSVQSAVRTGYDYHVDSFNIWDDCVVKIEDYSVTWTEDSTWGTTYYQETTLQPGYFRVCLENDWTSYDLISGKLEIVVEKEKHDKPDVKYCGFIETGEDLFWYSMGSSKIIELWWKNDWTRYPTTDLDMVVAWYDVDDNLNYEFVAGGSLRSPEGVYLPDAVDSDVYLSGYETYGLRERWKLYGYF